MTRGANLLLVDDRAENVGFVKDFLEHLGYAVHCEMGGRAALAYLASNDPDIVLLDLEMPDMDGLAVLASMRASGQLEKVCVIILSAHDKDEIEEECLEAGATAVLSKPLRLSQLKSALKAAESGESLS
jgi:CheY-like chemotaxis protein